MQNEEKKEFWALISLMGHVTLAGHLSEYTMGGCSFLKLTVPETSKQPEWTRLFKDNSVYSIDPVTEEVARYKAERLDIAPMSIWEADTMLKKHLEATGKVIIRKSDLPESFALPESGTHNTEFNDDDDEGPF
ncbi:hypothetical protein [Dyadobacter sp. CY312]|uniref:hypothetical protein n=1 Tax=Dyadobacter sp. CY312 TaxID=2907303 RepID=UPI001F16CE45|nr:hypothetical protein [Dyadobacter sp. CY312]MCE7039266.1 hypothetical protein [Dyadobacter sp. CY312]